ncbi:MAG: choice-of-anchor B family protein [Saprospiraceae bacterium]|nr:choice-of-anchor B family protein [Saprospiraceae bacterium]
MPGLFTRVNCQELGVKRSKSTNLSYLKFIIQKCLIFLFILFIALVANIHAQAQKMKLLGHWRDSSIVGSAAYDNAFNEAWGLAVNGHEYAIIGSTAGTHFIDITDPTKPFERYRFPGAFNGDGVIHRDYDDYNCMLYAVCDEGNSSLQIIDFSNLPDTAFVVYDSREFMTRVHNIYLDVPKARLYTCAESGVAGFKALGLYDLSDPAKPKFVGHYNRFGDITASHIHDAFARNDTVYLNCGNDGFAIMDFSDATDPKAIFTAKPNEYPHSGYNHSGWLTPDGKTYVMADENHGLPLKIYDLNDISNAQVVSLLYANKDTSVAIPHNPLVSCDYAYVSYYYDGLQVYNIIDPQEPKLEYYYPTSVLPNNRNYKGSWGNYPYLPSGNIVIADMQNGLFVVEGIEKLCNSVYNCLKVSTHDNLENKGLQVYPIPADENLKISLPESMVAETYAILSLTGLPIQTGTFTTTKMEVAIDRIMPGMYVFVIYTKQQVLFRQTFIKE